MSTIVLRSVKGSGLTNNEIDANFTNLNTDKIEATQTVTLTNKTLALGSNTISGTTAQFNTALTDGDFATLAGTETLTNKTLTAPVLANPSYSGATANGGTVTTIDINGGTIDGTVIGGTTPAAVSATTLSATHANGFGITSKTNDATAANNAGVLIYGVASATAATRRSILFLDPNGGDGSGGDYVALDVYGNGTFTIANEISGGVINLGIGGTYRASVSSTGLAVTGALSATGALNSGQLNFNGAGTYEIVNRNGTGIDFYVNAATLKAMELTASGNLGLGVTPSAWGGYLRTLDIGPGSSLTNANSFTQTWLASNAYYDTAWKYKNTAEASYYEQAAGIHKWYTAPSGTAGNPISFTQAMTLDASSHLTVAGGITTGSYTVATRPAHAAGRIIHVTDGGAGAVFQGSAGGAWVNLG